MGDVGLAYLKGLLEYFDSSKINELVDFYICPAYAVPSYASHIVGTSESTKHTVAPIIYANEISVWQGISECGIPTGVLL